MTSLEPRARRFLLPAVKRRIFKRSAGQVIHPGD